MSPVELNRKEMEWKHGQMERSTWDATKEGRSTGRESSFGAMARSTKEHLR